MVNLQDKIDAADPGDLVHVEHDDQIVPPIVLRQSIYLCGCKDPAHRVKAPPRVKVHDPDRYVQDNDLERALWLLHEFVDFQAEDRCAFDCNGHCHMHEHETTNEIGQDECIITVTLRFLKQAESPK